MSHPDSFIGINDINELSNNTTSKINISKLTQNPNNTYINTTSHSNIQSPSKEVFTFDDLNLNNIVPKNNPIEKLNSKSASEYLNSLHLKMRELTNENQELKFNFIQVNEILEKEKSDFNKKINILNSSIEILEKEKAKHIQQNIIEKENYENIIQSLKNENNKMSLRIKELIEENEKLKNNNFNLNIQIIELNKLNYENSQLKEQIKKIFQNNAKNTIKQLQESNGKKNDSKNIIKKSVTQNIYNKNSNIKIIPKKNMNNNQLKSNNRVDNKNLNKNKKKNNSKADLSTKENLEYIPQKYNKVKITENNKDTYDYKIDENYELYENQINEIMNIPHHDENEHFTFNNSLTSDTPKFKKNEIIPSIINYLSNEKSNN
jgi:hypothetical protein